MKATRLLALFGILFGTAHCAAESDTPEGVDDAEQAVDWDEVRAEKPANFRVATDGVLLAGTHPRPEHLKYLRDKMGVKSILSLQSLWQEAVWPVPSLDGKARLDVCFRMGLCEKKNAEHLDMNFFNRSWKVVYPNEIKSAEWVDEAMSLLADEKNQPVYVHCAYGLDRTSGIVALHRVFNEHKSPTDAFQEWRAIRPQVCTGKGSAAKTFVKRMDTAVETAKTATERKRFAFDLRKECTKPQPPPPDGFVMMDGKEGE